MTGHGVAGPDSQPGGIEPVARSAPALIAPALASWATAAGLLGLPVAAAAGLAVLAGTAAGWVRLALARADHAVRPARRRPATWLRWRGPAIRSGIGDAIARTSLGIVVSVAATAASVAFALHSVRSGPVPALAAREAVVTAEAVLTADPRIRPHRGGMARRDSVLAQARLMLVLTGAARYRVDVPVVLLGTGREWGRLLPSQRIRVAGRLAPAEPGALTAAVLLVRGPPMPLTGPSAVQRAAGAVRAGLREAVQVLPSDQRGLLPGLVLGDVSQMEDQVRADFTTAGLSHLTAVSGANLAVVASAALLLARAVGLPLPGRAAVAAIAMTGFAVVARPSPSVLRALVMGMIAALAVGTGRCRDGLAALAAAVLGLILFDPGLAREYGFALSVFATGGILVLAPRWRDRLAGHMPGCLAGAVAVPAAAQVAVTPVLVLMSGRLDLAAIPANLLAEPAVAPATTLGFAAAMVAPLSMGVAQLLVRPAGLAAGWIILVAERAARLPFATIRWPGGLLGLVLLAGMAVLGWPVLRRRAGRRITAAAAAGALLAVCVAEPLASRWPPPGWLLVACDVGQGDALAVSAGPDSAVVVDAGPEPGPADRCLRDLGVRRVPLIVLTHPHVDHVGGLAGVLRGRPVGAVVVSPVRVPEGEADRVSLELRRRRIPEWVMPVGTRWRIGAAELTVLAPTPFAAREGPGEGAVANNASVVLLARWFGPSGTVLGSALLAGDMETEAQGALLRHGVPHVDVLKVPHHGSFRQDPAFLAATRARAALVSVGAVNDYGHPAPLTMRRLIWLGMRTYRTDVCGDLAVVSAGGRLAVVSRGR